jgi:acyl dehydratase
MNLLRYEDFSLGQRFDLGSVTVTETEIVAFARQFDPQPFHTDRATAAHTPFGGVVASGWHTAALCMRLLVDGLLSRMDTLGSPGVDALRWLRPLRPDDTLHLHATISAMRPSESKPDRGVMTMHLEAYNQEDEMLLSMEGVNFVRRAPP